MQRNQIIEALVLNEISDDYENLDHVMKGIADTNITLDPVVTRNEVETAMKTLIRSGFASAHRLRSTPPYVEIVEGIPDELSSCWYYQTEAGKLFHASLPWPLDTERDSFSA